MTVVTIYWINLISVVDEIGTETETETESFSKTETKLKLKHKYETETEIETENISKLKSHCTEIYTSYTRIWVT